MNVLAASSWLAVCSFNLAKPRVCTEPATSGLHQEPDKLSTRPVSVGSNGLGLLVLRLVLSCSVLSVGDASCCSLGL
ncbi:hypothetical protein HaLaN_05181 [Haematococcus lacustris]|uniref:Uncharacterized protein n=1 Tax=Haematococcus lacustris TaxID=44745 RepID=A0A699YQ93_HAELA|nr:hypothetical protein HaLaN_05181 [Haematococcus lacustris]